MDLLLNNQISEFMNVQYIQDESRDEGFFIFINVERNKHLIGTYTMVVFRHVHILSKELCTFHTMHFQNKEFALYISEINKGIKLSFHTNLGHVMNYLNVIYYRDLLLLSGLVFYV